MLGQPADWIVEDVEAESEEASVVEVSVNPRGASK
jgi:hypothetical protein